MSQADGHARPSSRVQEIVPGAVWTISSQVGLPGGIPFPIAMTLVRHASGDITAHSPIEITDPEAAWIRSLGDVRTIIAPSLSHHLFARKFSERFADALVYGHENLNAKLRGWSVHEALRAGTKFGGDLESISVEGAASVGEHIFVHLPTNTLLVTDLVFNVVEAESLRTRLLLKSLGSYGKPKHSVAWKLLLVNDKKAFARTLDALRARQIERIVPAHGQVIRTNAPDVIGEIAESWSR